MFQINFKKMMQICWKKNVIIACTTLLLLIDICSGTSDVNDKQITTKNSSVHRQQDNFLVIDHLNDNEKETRLKWRDLMGKETTLDAGDSERFVNRWVSLINDAFYIIITRQFARDFFCTLSHAQLSD